MRGFDPRRATASPRHAEVYGRYERAYTIIDFAAAVAFVIGSCFFFDDSYALAADWLFLAGSVLFAVRPTISVAREMHLSRLPDLAAHHHDTHGRSDAVNPTGESTCPPPAGPSPSTSPC